MQKKLYLVTIMIFMTLILTSCMSHIEDTNGEDTKLETIDIQSKVEKGSYSSISSLSKSAYSGGTTYCLNYEDIDYNHIELSYGKISGVEKIHCSDVSKGDELLFTITSSVSKGNLEIALVGPDKTFIESVEVNSSVTLRVPSTEEGEYFIVVGGETATFEIEIDRIIN